MIFIYSIIIIILKLSIVESTNNNSVIFKSSHQVNTIHSYQLWFLIFLSLIFLITTLIFLLKNGLIDKICFMSDHDNFSEVIFDLENKKEIPPVKIVITEMDENFNRFKQRY